MVDDPKYQEFLINEYTYWILYIHQNQLGSLGRVYLWAKREEAESFEDMTDEELLEFKKAAQEVSMALDKAFSPDRLNVEFLGNETNHLHGHLVPRYKTTKEFEGIRFIDKNWGGRFIPVRPGEVSAEILTKIKREITERL